MTVNELNEKLKHTTPGVKVVQNAETAIQTYKTQRFFIITEGFCKGFDVIDDVEKFLCDMYWIEKTSEKGSHDRKEKNR